jgi:hypothetical protein
MESKELTNKQAYRLWLEFSNAIGITKIRAAYGNHWVRHPALGERIWSFTDKQNIIGWCALRPDPDPIVWHVSGVFPKFQFNGYITEIFNWSIKKSFELWPTAEAMFFSAVKGTTFCEWLMSNGREKRKIGEINYPKPGYIVFAVEKNFINL